MARLHVDSLLDKKTVKKAKVTLKAFKKGSEALGKAYDEALERIEGQLAEDASLAHRALSWITYARRPLRTLELCHALAIEPGDNELEPDAVYNIDDILSVCAGLVTVDKQSDVVRLVHYTTQEYLSTRFREGWMPEAKQDIAIACITYLSMDDLKSGACKDDASFEKRLDYRPLLGYAAHFWPAHAEEVQHQVTDCALAFLCNDALILAAEQADIGERGYTFENHSRHFTTGLTGIHLSARSGLVSLMVNLFEEPNLLVETDARDQYGRTPLLYAAGGGHEAVVRVLLARGDVEADARDIDGRTPLLYAAGGGHEAVVRVLLARDDVEADARDNFGGTPLLYAAEEGHEAVVRVLLAQDDVKADGRNNYGGTPLSYAARGGHEAVVRVLLARDDVEADRRDNYGGTPLSYAAKEGHEAVVRVLLARDDIKADARDKDGRTPLSYAAGGGHEAVVRVLLARDDVKADRRDNYKGTPLSYAAEEGHEAVVQVLLARDDVEADARDKDGQTPLSYAAEGGHEAVVRVLLARDDVEADARDNFGRTPLLRAAGGGHEAVVRILEYFMEKNTPPSPPTS